MPKRRSAIDAELDALYARLPDLQCKKLCADSCGVLPMSDRERTRIRQQGGVAITPAAEAMAIFQQDGDYTCEALRAGLCSVFAIRPLICRLWGLVADVEGMRCPHGCVPERWLTSVEAREFIAQSLAIGGGAGR